jgi:hypothetical protein
MICLILITNHQFSEINDSYGHKDYQLEKVFRNLITDSRTGTKISVKHSTVENNIWLNNQC